MKTTFSRLFFLGLILTWIGCSTQQNAEPKEQETTARDTVKVAPQLDRSELALLMREMYDEMKLVSDSLKSGKAVKTKYLERYREIHTATPTDSQKIDELYHGMSDAFLASYESFENSEAGQTEVFNAMVDQCLACHQQKCPGPAKIIRKLKINPEQG